jgi:hypothetical protein
MYLGSAVVFGYQRFHAQASFCSPDFTDIQSLAWRWRNGTDSCVIGEMNKTSMRAFVSTQPFAHQPRLHVRNEFFLELDESFVHK